MELRIGLLVEVEGDGREPATDQVLVDRIRGAADVRRDADLLGLEVVDQLLVIGRDELAVVVGGDQADRRGGLGEGEPDLRLRDGVAPELAEVRGQSHEVVDELRVLEGVEQHHLGVAEQHRDGPGADRDGADGRRRSGLDEALRTARGSRGAAPSCTGRASRAWRGATCPRARAPRWTARRSRSTSPGSRTPPPPWRGRCRRAPRPAGSARSSSSSR